MCIIYIHLYMAEAGGAWRHARRRSGSPSIYFRLRKTILANPVHEQIIITITMQYN